MELSEKLRSFMGLPEPRAPEQIAHEFVQMDTRRKGAPKEQQNILGPIEHGLYTEGVVTDMPIAALPLAVYTPAYSAGKATGAIKARSDASWEEIKESYKGIGRGLYNAMFGK